MSTTLPEPALVVPPHVDLVLEEVGKDLQLTQTQYERARQAYVSVGSWLQVPGSSLAPHNPEVYPQGSMALRTTVRPLHGDEHDLDLVCEVEDWTDTAMTLYQRVGARLEEHGTYAPILEGKKRCWRLNYAGDFHLDALPGRDDLVRPGNAIEVPDRSISDWKPSNPKDYVEWFETRARPYYELREAKVGPLPPPDPVDAGDPLRRAVQLMKRHRDVRFEGEEENAPRSIVLTTLAAKHYNRQESVAEALLWMLAGIHAEIQAADGVLEVRNPVNNDENFGDAWENNTKAYEEFIAYVEQFALDLRTLIKAPPGENFRKLAAKLFGTSVAKRAIDVYNERHGAPAAAALARIATGQSAPAKPWLRA